MYFDSLNAALHMDGHGVYVWSAYLITGLVLLAMVLLPGRRQGRLMKQLKAELRRQNGPAARGEER